MKRNVLFIVLALLLVLAGSAQAQAQVTITYVFSNGTVADADEVNTNFAQLSASSLNRAGGTVTGNIAVDAGITIDGVDVGTQSCGACAPTFSAVTVDGSASSGFASLNLTGTGGNAIAGFNSTLALSTTGNNTISLNSLGGSGTVSIGNAAIQTTRIGAGGGNLHLTLGGGTITTGSGAVALIDGTGKITALSATTLANLSGAALTTLSATNISSGTLDNARLTSAVVLNSAGGITFTGASAISTATGNLLIQASGVFNVKIGSITANPIELGQGGGAVTVFNALVAASSATSHFRGLHSSADNTAGATTTCNAAAAITLTFKNGLLTGCV